ncbi:hypothetical protein EUGRSUZ_E01660 [Eucalyptus grandis]|uniref:Uncharacterized protein n=2 Tax=Eucalyptus grandis TaxID=71139 RepID=A0ACC3KUT5_EUCGR|nr:hypothetical protein EUGRSUZ_E01660 [Eucalyptus grandis]
MPRRIPQGRLLHHCGQPQFVVALYLEVSKSERVRTPSPWSSCGVPVAWGCTSPTRAILILGKSSLPW